MSDTNKLELYTRGPRFGRGGSSLVDNRIVDLSDSYEIIEPEEPLDLRAYGRILAKQLAPFVIVFSFVFALGLTATLKKNRSTALKCCWKFRKKTRTFP